MRRQDTKTGTFNTKKVIFRCWPIIVPLSETLTYIYQGGEQGPGSEFHPRDESEKNYCGFLGTFLVQ